MTADPADHYAGIVVVTFPGHLDASARALDAQRGITVAIRDPDRHRMIVVLEAATRDGLVELHRTVRSIPGVAIADPIVHYVDDDPDGLSGRRGSPHHTEESRCSRP